MLQCKSKHCAVGFHKMQLDIDIEPILKLPFMG